MAMSSPPLNATVPAPKVPVLPKASPPPVTPTVPIVFASSTATKRESTVNAPAIVSEPPFSNSSA
jgi:hypothetical protein